MRFLTALYLIVFAFVATSDAVDSDKDKFAIADQSEFLHSGESHDVANRFLRVEEATESGDDLALDEDRKGGGGGGGRGGGGRSGRSSSTKRSGWFRRSSSTKSSGKSLGSRTRGFLDKFKFRRWEKQNKSPTEVNKNLDLTKAKDRELSSGYLSYWNARHPTLYVMPAAGHHSRDDKD